MRAILRGCLSTGPGAADEDDMLRRAEQSAGEEVRKLEAGDGEAINRGRKSRWRKMAQRMAIFESRAGVEGRSGKGSDDGGWCRRGWRSGGGPWAVRRRRKQPPNRPRTRRRPESATPIGFMHTRDDAVRNFDILIGQFFHISWKGRYSANVALEMLFRRIL